MTRRSLVRLFLLALLVAVAGGGYAALRQQQLNGRLLTAARRGTLRQVNQLIAEGADPNARSEWPLLPHYSYSALSAALDHRDPRIAEALLRSGADPHSTGHWGRSVLWFAKQRNDQRTVALLKRYGATR